MLRIKMAAVLLLILLSQSMARDKFFPFDSRSLSLQNGLKIILVKTESPVISYSTIVKTGSRDEFDKGKTGIAHLLGYLMCRGTGSLNTVSTSFDNSLYSLSLRSKDLERVIQAESNRFQNLEYSETDFRMAAGAVLGEYRRNLSDPRQVAFDRLLELSFAKHSYRHPVLGTQKDILKMPSLYGYSRKFFRQHYCPENSAILVVGNIDFKFTIALIKKYYSSWSRGYAGYRTIKEQIQTSERTATCKYNGKTRPILMIGFKSDGFNYNNKNILSAVLLKELLFGDASDIYRNLVLGQRKVLRLWTDFGITRDPFLLSVGVMLRDEKDITYVRERILESLDAVKKNKIGSQRLGNLKKCLKYRLLMSYKSPAAIVSSLRDMIGLTGDIIGLPSMYNNIDNLRQEDLLQAAKYYFSKERRNTVILTGSSK